MQSLTSSAAADFLIFFYFYGPTSAKTFLFFLFWIEQGRVEDCPRVLWLPWFQPSLLFQFLGSLQLKL